MKDYIFQKYIAAIVLLYYDDLCHCYFVVIILSTVVTK